MKDILLYFILMLVQPMSLLAQYTGGNGRGDYLVGGNGSFLSGLDGLYTGGVGRGDFTLFYALCTNPTNGGSIADNQTGCSPFDPALLTSSVTPIGYTGTLEYKWQKSTTSSSAGFTDIASSNAATYDPPAGLTATTWYKRIARVTCVSDWTSAKESNVIQIRVDPVSVGGSIAGSTTVCSGTNSTSLALSGYTGNVVKWQYSTNNWVNATDIVNTTTTLIASNLTTTTKYRAVIQSGVCSSANSSDATISVDPVSVGGSIA
ncbi:MAG: hypothetical protein NTY96_08755, partial [Bacteroidetes bacterium]|nr:hypothetical protein [Bacteroidota bacterium]